MWEATHLRGNRYAIRPAGALGTCGFHPFPWTVIYQFGRSKEEALRKSRHLIWAQENGQRSKP